MLSATVNDNDIRTILDNIEKFSKTYAPVFQKLSSIGYGIQAMIWSYDNHPVSLVFNKDSIQLCMLKDFPLINPLSPLGYLNVDETLATTTDMWKLRKYFAVNVYDSTGILSNQKVVASSTDTLSMVQDILSDLLSDPDTINENIDRIKTVYTYVVRLGLKKQGLYIQNPVKLDINCRAIPQDIQLTSLKKHAIKQITSI